MGVIVKKQLFLLIGVVLNTCVFSLADLNAMRLRDILNEDEAPAIALAAAGPRVVVAPERVVAPVRVVPAAVAPARGAVGGRDALVAAVAPADQQVLITAFKNLFTIPWSLGASITSSIDAATTNVESATKVFMRCLLEGIFCGVSLYLVSGNALGNSASQRLKLAGFALDDLMHQPPGHFNSSGLWTALLGLQYLGTFVGLSGLRLYGWVFGLIIGLRCAYDSLVKLPLSLFSGKYEVRRDPRYGYGFGLGN